MKLHKVVLSAVAAFALATTATSASADGKRYGAYNWTGFYAGAHLGAAWADMDWTWELPTLAEARRVSQSGSGVIGGGQIGAQYQFSNIVAGVEVSFSGLGVSDQTVSPNFVSGFDRTFTSSIDNLFTAVGRIGIAHDRLLTYVKGGYASARVELDTYRTTDGLHQTSSSKRQDGYVLGAGFEYAFAKQVSLGIEYNYVNLGSGDVLNVEIPPTITSHHRDIDTTISSVVARINIKLDREREREPLK